MELDFICIAVHKLLCTTNVLHCLPYMIVVVYDSENRMYQLHSV